MVKISSSNSVHPADMVIKNLGSEILNVPANHKCFSMSMS